MAPLSMQAPHKRSANLLTYPGRSVGVPGASLPMAGLAFQQATVRSVGVHGTLQKVPKQRVGRSRAHLQSKRFPNMELDEANPTCSASVDVALPKAISILLPA
eukprot:1033414-Pelagomonas_calceolata.AAC.1